MKARKIMSVILALTLIITSFASMSVYAAGSVSNTEGSYSISTDFEGYTGNENYTVASLQTYVNGLEVKNLASKCIGSGNFVNDKVGITNVATDRGTSLNLLHYDAYNVSQYAAVNVQPPADFNTAYQFKVSLKTSDTERPRAVRHSNCTSCLMIMFHESTISLMGNKTKFTWAVDTWYDFNIEVDTRTGEYYATVTCNGETETFVGTHSHIKNHNGYTYTQIMYYGANKADSTTKNNTYVDDLTIRQMSEVIKPSVSDISLTSDGNTVTASFTSTKNTGSVFYAIAIYNDNELINVVPSTMTLSSSDVNKEYKVSITVPSDGLTYKVKAFRWDAETISPFENAKAPEMTITTVKNN